MTTTVFDHWREAHGDAWRWPDFSPADIACRGTAKLLINKPVLDSLQALRDRLGKPRTVRSAYRSPEHNRAVGDATRSKDLDGAAFDIAMMNHAPAGLRGGGARGRVPRLRVLPALGVHAPRPRPGALCTLYLAIRPAPEGFAQNRTMKAGGAAGVATLGAAGGEGAQQVLTKRRQATPERLPEAPRSFKF